MNVVVETLVGTESGFDSFGETILLVELLSKRLPSLTCPE